jgi:hypothetical protein
VGIVPDGEPSERDSLNSGSYFINRRPSSYRAIRSASLQGVVRPTWFFGFFEEVVSTGGSAPFRPSSSCLLVLCFRSRFESSNCFQLILAP